MTISARVQAFLDDQGIAYDSIRHGRCGSNIEAAHAAHVPEDCVVKAVLLEDDRGYLMALVPANAHVRIGRLGRQMNRPALRLATEAELARLFADCAVGAVPPLGPAYGMDMVVDTSLAAKPELYMEAGDHEHLIHLQHADFARLTAGIRSFPFSKGPADPDTRFADMH